MTIAEHPLDIDDRTPAFVFSALGGFTCSICAPAAMTARQIESFVTATLGPPPGGQWSAVDKSRLGLGRKSPDTCNVASGREAGRQLMATHAAAAKSEGLDDQGPDCAVGQRLAPTTANPSPLAQCALCSQTPEVGAVCPNWARTDLCGGREVTRVPTAILGPQRTSRNVCWTVAIGGKRTQVGHHKSEAIDQ